LFCFETRSNYLAQDDLELMNLLPQPPELQDYSCVSPCLTIFSSFEQHTSIISWFLGNRSLELAGWVLCVSVSRAAMVRPGPHWRLNRRNSHFQVHLGCWKNLFPCGGRIESFRFHNSCQPETALVLGHRASPWASTPPQLASSKPAKAGEGVCWK
jgi:hypothetical protein